MTLLTSIVGGSSSGGSPTLIGEYKALLTANSRQLGLANTQNANTVTESGGGVWVRAGQVYPQTTYPELFARIGLVGVNIGTSKVITNNPSGATFTGRLMGSGAYSPDDDIYLFPLNANGGNVLIANSSMQQFQHRTLGGGNTVIYYNAYYGGANGTKRFLITSNQGLFSYTASSNSVSGPYALANYSNILFAATNSAPNTFTLAWSGPLNPPGSNGTIAYSSDSGSNWSTANSNSNYVSSIAYGNNIYLLQSYPGWVETSTNGIAWTGLQKQGTVYQYLTHYHYYNHHTGNHQQALNIPASHTNDPRHFYPRYWINNFKALGNTFFASTQEPWGYSGGHHYAAGYNGYPASNHLNDTSGASTLSTFYSSTDSRTWAYRGTLPNSGSPGTDTQVPILYSPPYIARITAVGGPGPGSSSGANNIFAAKTWWQHNYSNPNYAQGHNHWSHDGHHYGSFLHGHTQQPPVNVDYNRIYNYTPSVGSNISANVFTNSANAHASDNSYYIKAIGYGFIANGQQQFIYATSGGTITSSTDGWTWSQRLTGQANLNAIAYGRANNTNTYMVVGNSGSILTSTDIVNWTQRGGTYATDANGWVDVAYGNNIFIVAGNTGNLLVSNDGVNFAGTLAPSSMVSGATFGNSVFVITLSGGAVKYSIDGVYWRNSTSGESVDLTSVATDNTKYVFVGMAGKVRYTLNLANTWTAATITSSNNFYSVAYGNNLWLLGGANGSIFTSTDGISWTYRTSGTSNTILQVYYANNTYLYGGDNVLATSTDAVSWTVRNANAQGVKTISALRVGSLGYGNGVFIYGSQGFVGTSTDGVTWITSALGSKNTANANVVSTFYTGQINEIQYNSGNSLFIAVGDGGYIATSPNGSSWTVQNSRTGETFTSLAFGNSRYLVTGANGTAKISPNTIVWSGHASNANIYGIGFYSNANSNVFIMTGATVTYPPYTNSPVITNTLETSTDGIIWSTKTWKTTVPPQLVAATNTVAAVMEFCNDQTYFTGIAGTQVSQYPYATAQRVSFSYDSNSWSGLGLGAGVYNPITFINGQFWATGQYGLIANSYDGLFWTTTNVALQFSQTSSNATSNVTPYYNIDASVNWSTGFAALKFHAATGQYILPHKDGGIHFISKDLVTWTPRYSMVFDSNSYMNYITDGPLVVTSLTGNTIVYSANANNYTAASYNAASEFLVPQISAGSGAAPSGYSYENLQQIWYVKAKT